MITYPIISKNKMKLWKIKNKITGNLYYAVKTNDSGINKVSIYRDMLSDKFKLEAIISPELGRTLYEYVNNETIEVDIDLLLTP